MGVGGRMGVGGGAQGRGRGPFGVGRAVTFLAALHHTEPSLPPCTTCSVTGPLLLVQCLFFMPASLLLCFSCRRE